jgi:tRNA(Ile2) C34 agmatinyltransferase TiaS
MTNPKCPKCGSEMEQGFLVDHNYYTADQPEWVEGPVERSFWTGVKTRGKERRHVTTNRCVGCGYLESFAK